MKMNTLSLLARLWSHITIVRRRQLGALLVIMITASLMEVVSIGSVLPFLGILTAPERVFSNPIIQSIAKGLGFADAAQLLLPLTLFFILAAVLSGAARLILLWAQTRLSFAVGHDFSIQIYRRTLYQPYSVHVASNSSRVISAVVSKTDIVISYYLLPLLFVTSSTLILVAILSVLILIDPFVAFVIVGIFGILYGLIVIATKRRLARDSQSVGFESNNVIKALQEGLGGIRDVLIEGSQEAYCKIYRDADLKLRKSQGTIQIISGAPRFLIESLGMVLIAMLAYFLADRQGGMAAAIPVLGAFAIGAQRMLPVLQLIYFSTSNVIGYRNSLEDVLDMLDQPLPAYVDKPAAPPLMFNSTIKFEDVGFCYDLNGEPVLEGIDLTILKGSRIGFIGTTGSGKSTLLDILMGMLQPTKGSIFVDGVPITVENCRSWQAHIAHVPQRIFLADATVSENVAFGIPRERIDNERVRFSANQAQLGESIESWPDHYNTMVGERGVKLSGGQCQRIGIARAFYKLADVIVFDEATSALDVDTEQAVMDAIEHIGRDVTVLIVAHRLTTLRKCDLIFELENGRIKRSGSYSEIVAI